MATRLQVRK